MHFLRVNVTRYDAVKTIHDVITTANQFPLLLNFHILLNSCLAGLEIIKLKTSDVERLIEYVYSVAVYQKYLTRLGEMIIFSPKLENYQFSQPR